CKVNLNLENLFTGSYESKNYNCLWDFGSGFFDTIDTDKKCNPGYVSYSTGFFSIIAKIEEKDNPLNFKTGSLSFENFESYTTSNKSGSSGGGTSYITSIKDIILQSGAEKVSEGKYICIDEVCKINLKYDKSYNESCLWDFGGGNFREKNIYTCNPGFVYYYNGEYNVNLKINKDGNYIGEKNISIINNYIDKAIEYNIKPIARISLQGKLGKNKELIGNKLICKNSKTCSVNFDGSDSTDANKDNLDFFWDFGNGEYAEKSNPTSIEYLPGKYKIRLKVVDRFGEFSEDYFFVEVYESVEKIEELNQDIIDFIKVTEVLPNPIGKEEYEWIKIKNDSINFVNIKGLEIDDKIGEGSKSYIIKNDVFLLPYQEKKLYKSETKLNLNNSFDEVNLLYNSQIIDSLVWNYEVPEDYVVKKEIKEKVKVIRIIDGDTIVIQFQDGKTEKLRFIGVDTPETKHPKKEVEKFGIEVSNFTKDMLQGKEVFLELDYENYRDKYGRLLGYIWLQDANFNKLLIEKGYARAYLYFPFKYKEEFEKAEKEAKKNKLGIWGNEEVKREIEELKKIEDKQMMKNISFNEGLNFKSIIGRISSLNDSNNIKTKFLLNIKTVFIPKYDKKSIEKEALGEFDVLLGELLPKYNKKIKTTKLKQEKIITYKTSKLKSGLKITGTTFPNAKIILNFDELKYETISDNSGKYSFLISDNLKVGEYKLDFLVFSGEKEYNYEVPKPINLSRDYIFGVQDYKVKKATKKTKTKKSKKTKKKKVLANNNTKKMKYDVKDIKKEEDKSPSKNIIYIFLLSIIATIFGYILVRKN
ncbi:hypothetical protein EOM39_06250, partial [Candidatus Gracilibacteria bacterium]|nr:hypothetical protein [Candidatus Gracilibacteria bacterium]